MTVCATGTPVALGGSACPATIGRSSASKNPGPTAAVQKQITVRRPVAGCGPRFRRTRWRFGTVPGTILSANVTAITPGSCVIPRSSSAYVAAPLAQRPEDLASSSEGRCKSMRAAAGGRHVRCNCQTTCAGGRFGTFGFLAVVIAAVGLYARDGVRVEQRRREMGIQLALGATPRTSLRGVVRESVGLAAIGASIGTVVARIGSRSLEGLLSSDLARRSRDHV